jgi:hypothetical protein
VAPQIWCIAAAAEILASGVVAVVVLKQFVLAIGDLTGPRYSEQPIMMLHPVSNPPGAGAQVPPIPSNARVIVRPTSVRMKHTSTCRTGSE